MLEKIKQILILFPETEKTGVLIETPDRSEEYQAIVDELNLLGFTGTWRAAGERKIGENTCNSM